MKKRCIRPFDLEEAKKGALVETKSGRKARIVCYDRKSRAEFPLLVLIEAYDGKTEDSYTYPNSGKFNDLDKAHDYDLVLVEYLEEEQLYTGGLVRKGLVLKNYDEHSVEVDKKPQYEVGGNHYQMAIQPIDFIMKNKLPFCEGNVVKYITRHKNKNHEEDVEKAISYCVFILKNEYGYTDENIKSMFNK